MKYIKIKNLNPLMQARLCLVVIVLISLSILMVFLYKDFYQTIIHVQKVFVLQQEVSTENIDIIKFNKVLNTHNYKINSVIENNIFDPFNIQKIKQKNENTKN